MSGEAVIKQAVENGEKIKATLDDLRVHLSHNGPLLLIVMFFFTEHLARQQFSNMVGFLSSGWQQFLVGCSKKVVVN